MKTCTEFEIGLLVCLSVYRSCEHRAIYSRKGNVERERERKKLNILGTRASRKDVLMYKSCCDCLHILLIEERGRRGK